MSTQEARRPLGRPPTVSDEEIATLEKQGLNGSEIGRRVGLTPQAVSLRLKRLREAREKVREGNLPWTVKAAHSKGYVYRAAMAYGRWRAGKPDLGERERRERAELEAWLTKHNAVLCYDRDEGFMVRPRRDTDGPDLLAPYTTE